MEGEKRTSLLPPSARCFFTSSRTAIGVTFVTASSLITSKYTPIMNFLTERRDIDFYLVKCRPISFRLSLLDSSFQEIRNLRSVDCTKAQNIVRKTWLSCLPFQDEGSLVKLVGPFLSKLCVCMSV